MPLVELTGVITKPIVLMVRLFANMLAGHMIVTVFVALIFIFGQTGGVATGLAVSPRITSYNVCYTKLLRTTKKASKKLHLIC